MLNQGLEQDKEKPTKGILDAPPRTTFFLGLFVGIAGTAIASLLIVVPLLNASGDGSASNATVRGNTTNTAPAATAPDAGQGGGPVAVDITKPSADGDYYRGVEPEKADIVLVEYSDFECPFCQRLHPTMKQLLTDYDGKISWVYRHYPLTSIHPQADPAAQAAECVGNLGGNDAFWAFADALFENQSALGDDLYARLAGEAGVTAGDFTDCYQAKQYQNIVQTDTSEGTTAGVNGTPATFVLPKNDTSQAQLISGALPTASFKQVIESLL